MQFELDTHLSIGDVLTAASIIIGLFAAALTLQKQLQDGTLALMRFNKTLKSTHYAELDQIYQHILTIAIERPLLRNPSKIENHEDRDSYDAYAFMVWNFLETIRDRVDEDGELRATWAPVIGAEHSVHREWFAREAFCRDWEAVDHKFCKSFRVFILEHQWIGADWSPRDTLDLANPHVVAARNEVGL